MGFLDDAKAMAGDVCGEGNEIVNNIPKTADEVASQAAQDISQVGEEIKELAGIKDEEVQSCVACQGDPEAAHTCIG